MRVIEYTLQEIRSEYHAAGRDAEFENYVDKLRSEGRWPFDGRDRLPRTGRMLHSA